MKRVSSGRRALACVTLGLLTAGLLAGCGAPPGGSSGPPTVTFATAEKSGLPCTVEGRPETATIRRATGQPTEFTLFEEPTARRLSIVVPTEVSVPANLQSATGAAVAGQYDSENRVFRATAITTKVPNRDQQH